MESIKEICIDLINSIVKQQRSLCQICLKAYGEDDDRTREQLRLLGKYSMALNNYTNAERQKER